MEEARIERQDSSLSEINREDSEEILSNKISCLETCGENREDTEEIRSGCEPNSTESRNIEDSKEVTQETIRLRFVVNKEVIPKAGVSLT